MRLFNRLIAAFSDRADYKAALLAIEEAIRSEKLSPLNKRQTATKFVEPRGWRSHIDGIDWVELNMYANEHEMPFETVDDLRLVLKSITKS